MGPAAAPNTIELGLSGQGAAVGLLGRANFLSPKAEIVLNIDNDHLDYFKTFDNIKNAFSKYATLIPEDGALITNADDSNCLALREHVKGKFITYGIQNECANYRCCYEQHKQSDILAHSV